MKKAAIAIIAILAATGIAAGYMIVGKNEQKQQPPVPTTAKAVYDLELISKQKVTSGQATDIAFTVRDQSEESLQRLDTVHGQEIHVFAIRKDRSDFQHLHPSYDSKDDTYMLSSVTFATDGEYRLFVDFTLSASPVDAEQVKIPTTLVSDIRVGDIAAYQAQQLNTEQLVGTDGSITAEIFDAPNDGGGSGYTSGVTSALPVFISKNDQDYAGYQDNFGEFGYFVAISPDLTLVHAYPNTTTKSYLMGFNAIFPTPGQYTAYLQLKDEDTMRTMDFTINVR